MFTKLQNIKEKGLVSTAILVSASIVGMLVLALSTLGWRWQTVQAQSAPQQCRQGCKTDNGCPKDSFDISPTCRNQYDPNNEGRLKCGKLKVGIDHFCDNGKCSSKRVQEVVTDDCEEVEGGGYLCCKSKGGGSGERSGGGGQGNFGSGSMPGFGGSGL